MAEIRCGNCGELHGSVAEVKACHQAGPATSRASATRSAQAPEPKADPMPEPAAPQTLGASLGPGPDALGRTLVIPAGARVPEAWRKCDIFEVDADIVSDPELTADELSELWFKRERYVIELSVDLPVGESDDSPVWQLEPGFRFQQDRLHHLVFSNAVRLIAADDAQLASELADRAAGLGATIGGSADVILPDGTHAWLDGGPLDPLVTPEPIVHSVSLCAGKLHPLGKASPAAELATDQLEAVAHTGGAARIIAPAGSGKTRVLTERARHLISNWGLPTSALTLVAFNKRAQLEMADRTRDLPGLRVRTLNALALQIVNSQQSVNTVSERDVRRLITNMVQFPRRANADPVASWFEALTAVRLGLRDPDEVEGSFHGDVDGFGDVFEKFRSKLANANSVDFDEQIYMAIEILLRDPRARRKAQLNCSVLLVDEFQDLTPAHLLLVRLLAGPRADVFGVGDDDQTIYGFTGANPRWLIDYSDYFPGARAHALEVNYRCAPGVVNGAASLLEYNSERVAKRILPDPTRKVQEGDLTLVTADDPTSELVRRVQALVASGTAAREILVLSRVNVTLAVPQVALAHSGLPVIGAVGSALLDRTGVRAALAWLRVVSNPKRMSGPDITESGRRPSRGLSPRVLEWMAENTELVGIAQLSRRLKDKDAAKIIDWISEVKRLSKLVDEGASTAELLSEIQDSVGLASAMGTLDASRGNADRSTHIDDLTALVALAALEPNPAEFGPWLRDALDQPTAAEGDGIMLSTVHRVKGQEWPHVFVFGVDQGSFPHRLAERPEERRVFHVALTRSSVQTTVIADAGRPSQFLSELKSERDKAAPEIIAERPKDRSKSAKKPTKKPRGSASATPDIDLTSDQEATFTALKRWRLEAARKSKVPAYIVFGDMVLRTIAKDNPDSLVKLAKVKGVGPAKLENYGDEVLSVLSQR
jgi:DNA helicase-2/ATP-dependent DNA helicase PcrA